MCVFAYNIALLQSQKLCEAFVFVYRTVVCSYAFPIDGGLGAGQILSFEERWQVGGTSAEHLATAFANFSIGLVLLGMILSSSRT